MSRMYGGWARAMGGWLFAAVGCGGTTVIPPSEAPKPSTAAESLVCDRPVENFAQGAVGQFPAGWKVRDDGQEGLGAQTYQIAELDGERVLHGTWQQETVTIGLVIENWDLNQHPVLRYRWRAVKLPAGADETKDGLNDTGAAVYAIWKVGFPMYVRGIKYAWSSTLPTGTRTSKRLKHDQMLVMESGETNLDTWQTVEVDVQAHALTFFERDGGVGNPNGIALMTDADSTETAAEAYFADFELCHYE
ncbi:MAG: DUF3047 domain-containing protein [Myxococcota bacterium]